MLCDQVKIMRNILFRVQEQFKSKSFFLLSQPAVAINVCVHINHHAKTIHAG